MTLIFYQCFHYFSPAKKAPGQETVAINRFCAQTPQLAEQNCKEQDVTSCQTCDIDKCNGAAQYGPVAALVVAIPVMIAKTFLF